ncbi:phospho-sugar mutase [Mycoplasma crocodyli]|uniref:Phosphomannomutase n=1 Tax=Mycoplasma crocodyli (strain ATCC 51981 / MP145) TaxID=512564 RepID=D5E5F3_MYCCM|nr:phospho-sugar mutase [Mycoplasma crocodyli]ADE19954.1 phosphomannomutase [Mycoplasma crocodyli MP145]
MKNYEKLDFGTAGIRGILGPNENQLNENYIYQIANGVAKYLKQNKCLNQSVVIGRDNRRKSKDFALLFAHIISSYGIKVYYSQEITPTPFLSYLILKLKVGIGINITASHNPAQYNGVKLYNKNANQMLPDEIKELKAFFEPYKNILNTLDTYNDISNIEYVEPKLKSEYIQKVIKVGGGFNQGNLRIAYSPQHGTGAYYATRILDALVDIKNTYFATKQMIEDPNFTYSENPNPESLSAYTELINVARNNNDIDLLITTDPDSDRVGAMIKHNDEYVLLDGNQTATIILDYLINFNKGNLEDTYMVYSYVSSNLPAIIAKKNNVKVFEVPTGFKWIGDLINKNQNLRHLFSFEESYGSLIDEELARDKDALQSLVIIIKIAQYYKNKGMTLIDALNSIYRKYSFVKSKTISHEMSDMSMIKNFREKFNSLSFPNSTYQKIDYLNDNNPTDMIKYKFDDNSWISYRPSGTEPKIKFYIFALDKDEATAQNKLENYQKIIEVLIKH